VSLHPHPYPRLLSDIVDMKRERGDEEFELEEFEAVAQRDFECGLNATVEGAARNMRRWIKHSYPGPEWQGERKRFLLDLDAAMDGTFFDRKAA
jgi:hypothetical protein